jgi:hypothetical protein
MLTQQDPVLSADLIARERSQELFIASSGRCHSAEKNPVIQTDLIQSEIHGS